LAVIVAVEAPADGVDARGILQGAIRPIRATRLIWAPSLWLTVLSAWQGGTGPVMVEVPAGAVGRCRSR